MRRVGMGVAAGLMAAAAGLQAASFAVGDGKIHLVACVLMVLAALGMAVQAS